MSGHSKWSNIKNKKAANDATRGSAFTKLAKAITVAYRTNHGINLAVEKARAASMPNENIERARDKGLGKGGEELVELQIEGFGPGGVVVIIEIITDNRNRSVAEIRALMEKHGGRMGEMGSVAYMFDLDSGLYKPKYPVPASDQAEMFLTLLREHADVQEVYGNLG